MAVSSGRCAVRRESRRIAVTVKLESLKGRYRGRTLLVVSCGPSARHWEEVRSRLPDDTVIACIKQAIFLCGKEASIHFFNAFNSQRYFPHNRTALKVCVDDAKSPVCFNSRDLAFSLDPATCGGLSDSVASTGKFEAYTIERTGLLKPWGPGIIYEVVAYLSIFLGFQDIHTVGWDVASEPEQPAGGATRIAHFYDSPLAASRAPSTEREWLVANQVRYRLKAYARHLLGLPYNRMPKLDTEGEIPAIVRSLPRFFEWLEAEGTSLTMHTEVGTRSINDSIRRHIVDLGMPPGVVQLPAVSSMP